MNDLEILTDLIRKGEIAERGCSKNPTIITPHGIQQDIESITSSSGAT